MERFLNPFYPPLEERPPLPALYVPASMAVLILGFAIGPGRIRTAATTSLLLLLAFVRPGYADIGVTRDYGLSGLIVIFILSFVDLSFSDPRWVGKPKVVRGSSSSSNDAGVAWRDLQTWPARLLWGFRLATTTRGIGWDWQVKGVPLHTEADVPRFRFAAWRALDLARHIAFKCLAIYGIGFCLTVGPAVAQTSPWTSYLVKVAENWCGAVWGWNTIGIAASGSAAICALLGIFEPWTWPPMLGSLSDAWSVRQAWRYVFKSVRL